MGAKQILVINSKGGVGKSTLTSNLASYFSFKGRTALCDFDRQMSGVRWLERRDPSRRTIGSITGWEYRSADDYDWMIMDTPAGITRKDMMSLIARSDVIIIPVLPSPIDIHAAADFIRDLVVYGRIRTTQKPLAIVANRVKVNTAVYDLLKSFLTSLRLPFVTSLRDSQNYIHASIHGIGIFEMDPVMVHRDIEQWQPLLRWINEAAEKGRIPLANHSRPRPNPVAQGRGEKPVLRVVS